MYRVKEEAVAVTMLAELGDRWKEYDCIGIDEGQFYKDVVDFAENAASEGKIVIMSVLSGTSFRKPFNDVLELIPKCEKIKQLNAICKICSSSASFTLRTTVDDRVELIGGGDLYMPVCRECFNFKTHEQEQEKLKRQNTLEVVKFRGDDGNEDSLLIVTKTPQSKGTPGQPQSDNSMSSIEKGGSNNSSPDQGNFSPISE